MQANPREKKFDAVKMMREIRDRLSEKYLEMPELEEKDLEAIRREYGIKPEGKSKVSGSNLCENKGSGC